MGTNYYARIIPTREKKNKLIELIENDEFNAIKDTVDLYYRSPNSYNWRGGEIHLGKQSGGWKFLWNPNWWKVNEGSYDSKKREYVDKWVVRKYYDLNKNSILRFLQRPDIRLFDEYGEEINNKKEWFDDIVKRDSGTWYGKPLLDNKLYFETTEDGKDEWRRSIFRVRSEEKQFWEDQGFDAEYLDFYSDGLRFSSSCEFS